jgi:lipopolysaccharide biosynthesis glycosyltransferase
MANIFCNLFFILCYSIQLDLCKKILKEVLEYSVEITFEKITEDDLPDWAKTTK